MSSLDASQPPLNSYAAPWGPSLISTFIATVIYGITVFQTFYYYTHHGNRDKPAWLVLVAAVFVLDTVAMALFMYCVYYYLVPSWGIPEMLRPDVKAFPSEYFITTALAFIVQNFYINTIRALRAPIVVTVLLFLISLTALASGFILPIIQLRLKFVDVIVVYWLNHTAFNIARGTALACDVGIVIALCWLFGIRKTDVRRANNVLDSLILFSVQRGALQALVQGGEVIAYAVKPSGVLFLPFHVIVSRIYCTSLLATLNSREYVLSRGAATRKREDGVVAAPVDLSDAEAARRPGTSRWASTLDATRPVLTSFLEPPFLFSSAFSGSGPNLEPGASSPHPGPSALAGSMSEKNPKDEHNLGLVDLSELNAGSIDFKENEGKSQAGSDSDSGNTTEKGRR